MNTTDWVSAVSSVVAAVIAVVTLITVYIGAIQLLSQNRMYRRGLSWRSIGPWQSTVARWALFGLQRRISAPSVTLKTLVDKKWQPNIIFPLGFPRNKHECIEKAVDKVQAQASWVNFMQALGLSPDSDAFYEMQDATELVNGIVPMPWKGKDLAGLCSILGFQSSEANPSFKDPMPIPMQWSGPLGWLQFRESAHGCVAEFRRRMVLDNQISISQELRDKTNFPSVEFKPESYFLRSRLWLSINGLALKDNKTLYLGGADKHGRPQETDEDSEQTEEQLFKELESQDLDNEDILKRLFGKAESRPEALRRQTERNERATATKSSGRNGNIPDFLDAMLRDTMDAAKKKQVFRRCPGLLSVTVQGELAYNRGLKIEDCYEFDRKYTDPVDVEYESYPHNLGDLYMDADLLSYMKQAMLLLQPDGFYFSCTYSLYRDICEVYEHISEQSNGRKQIFSEKFLTSWDARNDNEDHQRLRFAMELCNNLQKTRKEARACFTVEDMQLLAKTNMMLQEYLQRKPKPDQDSDLVWAMLYCRRFVPDVLNALTRANYDALLKISISCSNNQLDCTALNLNMSEEDRNADDWHYKTAHVADGEFTGFQMLASLCIVLITYYWIDAEWITDVSAYDATLPQSILMC